MRSLENFVQFYKICSAVLCVLVEEAFYFVDSFLEDSSVVPLFHFDDYDQCLRKNFLYCSFTFQLHPKNPSNTTPIWDVIKEISSKPSNYRHDLLRHGICIPETCPSIKNSSHLSNISRVVEGVNLCYNQKYDSFGLGGEVVNIHCENQNSPYIVDAHDILFIIFVSLYFAFAIFASVYEGIARYKSKEEYYKITETTIGKIVSAFSIPKNFYRLKSIDRKHFDPLGCIQGIRFYNMVCVILAHTLMVQFATPVANPIYTETVTTKFFNAFVLNGGYAVQTFLLISGWLLTYNIFKTFEGKRKLELRHLLIIFVNRYIRLTPTVAFVIALHSTWMVRISRGPFWDKLLGQEYRNCRENWWTNLLYVNNFVGKEKMCLQHTWYLATDTQLFVLSLLVIFFLKKYQKYCKYILLSFLALGVTIPAVISYVKNYDILVRQFPEPLYNFCLTIPQWHTMYSASYSNISGYAIGIIFGLVFYEMKRKNFTITKWHVTLWWILSFGLPLFVVLIAGRMYQPEYTYTRLEAALYWGFGKAIFALGLGVGIIGMTQNIGWFVNWFCRWHPAQILGRLTFSAYLIHVGLVKLRAGHHHHPLYSSDFLLLHSCLGDVTLAYLIATLITLFIEMPISALQKLLVNKNI